MNNRHENEFAHNRSILWKADQVWGRAGVAGGLRVRRRAKMMVDQAGIRPGVKLLEVGCGTGELTARLAPTGAEIVSTDLDENFLKQAKERVLFENVRFEKAAGEALQNFKAEVFDVVCGLSILHHLEIGPALRSIYRVLKPGGRAVFAEPNMANPQIFLQKNIPWLKKLAGDSPDETAFFRPQVARQFLQAGFKQVAVEPFDFLHPAIPDCAAGFFDGFGRALERIPGLREIAGSLFIFAVK